MGEIRSPSLTLAVRPASYAALVRPLSARGILAAAGCGRGQERSFGTSLFFASSVRRDSLPPRAEKRSIFGHETAFWHDGRALSL